MNKREIVLIVFTLILMLISFIWVKVAEVDSRGEFIMQYRDWVFVAISVVITLFVASSLVVIFRASPKDDYKENFTANITHELKTPISSISLAIQLLKDSDRKTLEDVKVRRLLNIIEQESKRMKLLVDKVLQFSMFDGKLGSLHLRSIDVQELLLYIAQIYEIQIKNIGGSIDLNFNANNTLVKTDKEHLTNVIFNLFENAIKYRKADTPLSIILGLDNKDGNLLISVQDNGIGIPKNSLKLIFDKYYRVNNGKRHDVKGFGIGLAYVSSVIRHFGGRINVESELSVGTKMIIELPIFYNLE